MHTATSSLIFNLRGLARLILFARNQCFISQSFLLNKVPIRNLKLLGLGVRILEDHLVFGIALNLVVVGVIVELHVLCQRIISVHCSLAVRVVGVLRARCRCNLPLSPGLINDLLLLLLQGEVVTNALLVHLEFFRADVDLVVDCLEEVPLNSVQILHCQSTDRGNVRIAVEHIVVKLRQYKY